MRPLPAIAAAVGAAAAAISNALRRTPAAPSERVALLRQNLAVTVDELRHAQDVNRALEATIVQREATITDLRTLNERNAVACVNLIKSLNGANARCAEYKNQLRASGIPLPEPPYFLAVLDDGSVAGPFGRN